MTDEYQSIPVAVARAAVQESGLLESLQGPGLRPAGWCTDRVSVSLRT